MLPAGIAGPHCHVCVRLSVQFVLGGGGISWISRLNVNESRGAAEWERAVSNLGGDVLRAWEVVH